MKKFLSVIIVFIFSITLLNNVAFAITNNEKIILAKVQAEKAIKARFGNKANIQWRYYQGKPDVWIDGKSVVVYGNVNGKNFSCDVIVDEAKNQIYVNQLDF